ncbi:hypothetical protein K2173_023006 [Erythroxylum novogranatense]|uniref:DIS3-like exonuclease 2 n=1 Tax=Erythroxylum novogranatense TaxID=1862640 RepID=A0AAV8T7Y1_9ROSI|nr:hypothetical protein K2173_023006 [Erythroxylum novogranatense]
MKAAMEVKNVVAEDSGDKDKKKKSKRRSNRRSRQTTSNTSNLASSSANEICGDDLLQFPRNDNNTKNLAREAESNTRNLGECGLTAVSDVTFNSMPTLHIFEPDHQLLPSDMGETLFSKSCPERFAGGDPYPSEFLLLHPYEGHAQCRIFLPHWSSQFVDEALEKSEAFKALFRVNAHNRLEAYCKIEGVPTDILISGIAAQNRAVEGDLVVIKIDPLSLWPKIKGSNVSSNKLSSAEASSLVTQANNITSCSYKGKNKMEVEHEHTDPMIQVLLQKGFHNEDVCADKSILLNSSMPMGYNFFNGQHPSSSSVLASTNTMLLDGQTEALSGVEWLCAMVSKHPSKRPTGKVMAIWERSHRRDAVVGFLNVKHWYNYKEGCRQDLKKKKKSLSISDCKYIQLAPTDLRFPKMMVPVKGLPDYIQRRLEDGDTTVETELVASKIDVWGEESPFPECHVVHGFGQGSEMQSWINAILYENAICCSDFSPKSLACLPDGTWQVPPEELQSRKDLRGLCIVTIDPSTATDLDDALSVEKLSDGTVRVGVHIADASYFVLPGTALDEEAKSRSTSVYMLQRKLPMLPPLLSENLCSLNPGVDRLAFSILWDFNSTGDVIDRWVGRSVIRSCCKLSYEHAQDIVDGVIDEVACKSSRDDLPRLHGNFEMSDVVECVLTLHGISKTLREKRFKDGALWLENSKIVFKLDDNGIPYDGFLSERKDSNFMVEEFMLLANRTAAEIISQAFPDSALLRRHPEPNMRKLREFEAFCMKHGLEMDTSSGHFHGSLECIREKLKDDSVLFDIFISFATKPMQPATYFCTGDLKEKSEWAHYALAAPLYTHFTSPLRRYPDIVVHRILAAAIEAEVLYLKGSSASCKVRFGPKVVKSLTGTSFDKDAAESFEGREALLAAASKHRIPCSDLLSDIVAYCNDRKLASRHVKDACDKLYLWVLLKKKEVLLSEARVLGLGQRFMSIYVNKLGIERRINYEDVERLTVEWLEITSTLVLHLCPYKRSSRRSGPGYYKPLEEVALVTYPNDPKVEPDGDCESDGIPVSRKSGNSVVSPHSDSILKSDIEPMFFPLTLRPLSTIPVALYAVGGNDGPIDIGVRLFTSSYFS